MGNDYSLFHYFFRIFTLERKEENSFTGVYGRPVISISLNSVIHGSLHSACREPSFQIAPGSLCH